MPSDKCARVFLNSQCWGWEKSHLNNDGILIMGPYKHLLLGLSFPSPIIWKSWELIDPIAHNEGLGIGIPGGQQCVITVCCEGGGIPKNDHEYHHAVLGDVGLLIQLVRLLLVGRNRLLWGYTPLKFNIYTPNSGI